MESHFSCRTLDDTEVADGQPAIKKQTVGCLPVDLPGIFQYVGLLNGLDKSDFMSSRVSLLTELHTTFNWFRTYFMKQAQSFINVRFQEGFSTIPIWRYPCFVRRCMNQKTSKSLMLKKFRSLVRYWYDLVYGPDRLFDFLFDADVGLKVLINENMLKLIRSSRCKKIPLLVFMKLCS